MILLQNTLNKMETYYKKNRIKLLKYQKNYNIRYRTSKKLYDKKYNKYRDWKVLYHYYKNKYLSEWIKYFIKKPKCMICNKKLNYFSGNRHNLVCFDHSKKKSRNYLTPYSWLLHHSPFIKINIRRWKLLNFGILCNQCNIRLPNKKRKWWLEKALIYTNKNEMASRISN